MIRIEPATVGDVERCLEIRYAAFVRHAPAAYTPEEVENLLRDVDPDEMHVMVRERQLFVARDGDGVVGLAGWKDTNLRHVYVDPARTRTGIGSALVAYVEADFADRTGRDEIAAGVGLQAEQFYRALGYRFVRRLTDWDGSEYLQMAHRVSPRTGTTPDPRAPADRERTTGPTGTRADPA